MIRSALRLVAPSRFMLAAGLLLAASGPQAAESPSTSPAVPTPADFAQRPDFSQVTVSPDGQHLAMLTRNGDNQILTVLRLSDMQPVANMDMSFYRQGIASYVWDSPTRLVASLTYDNDWAGRVVATGELVALNIPTNSFKYLLGYKAESDTDRDSNTRFNYNRVARFTGYGRIIAATPDKPDSVLVAIGNFGEKKHDKVIELDTRDGQYKVVATSPGEAGFRLDYRADAQGRLRYAILDEFSQQRDTRVFRRTADDTAWVEAADLGHRDLSPYWIGRDGTWTYFTSDDGKLPGRFCLLRQHTDGSGPLEEILCQTGSTPFNYIDARDGNSLVGVWTDPDKPTLKVLADGPDIRLLSGLQATLGNDTLVDPVSSSLDGRLRVILARSDRNPGTYYLYDRDTRKLEELFGIYPNLPLDAMRPTRAVRFAARDGLPIHGFLTLPAPRPDGRKPPLVVMPHGGPVDTSDDWFYDPETQLLATHGFAVLRVNFRGSDGYGVAFKRASRRQWGKAMVDDVTDGVRHVVKEGWVDAERIGIYGVSYGGYSALMGGVREPELYKAVVTYAGVSDLVRQTQDSDVAENKGDGLYMGKYIGDDPAELRAQSPMTYIDRLKAPVMIVHGEDDKRVPFSQAQILRAALDKRDMPYEWFVREKEGHSFARLENRRAFNEALLAFLDRHLKNRPAAAP